ncbi:MAG: phage tail assembly protein [Clostridia bacterium]|nr:phage tail assembly protein [Clostridia bacterium]
MPFVTEFEFILPRGYVDREGEVHQKGLMRLATAADEILPMKDPRVQQNPSYLTIILLSRVITKLGTLKALNTSIIEGLFTSDLAFLHDFYSRINETGISSVKAVCPKCEHGFEVETSPAGE